MQDKNKEVALKTAISQLEKKYGVGTLMRWEISPCNKWMLFQLALLIWI
jgi:hypothetical protein